MALVHDFLLARGGAERVLVDLARLYPDAPVYTLLSDRKVTEALLPGRIIYVSRLGRWPAWARQRFALLLPFFPSAVEAFDLRDFDLVISSSGAWSKGVVTRLSTKHLAYLHSPMRFVWERPEEALRTRGQWWMPKIVLRLLQSYLRLWDLQASERPDQLLANSRYTKARIAKYYRKEAPIIYPAATELYEKHGRNQEDLAKAYFLVVARLTSSKGVDAAVDAFTKLGLPLLVVGNGPERKRLEKQAGPNIRFSGTLADAELAQCYAQARALIQPSVEDFGLVAAEALSFGVPVVAVASGGVQELIRHGKEGVLYPSPTPEALSVALLEFLALEKEGAFAPEALRKSVVHLSFDAFAKGIEDAVRRLFLAN